MTVVEEGGEGVCLSPIPFEIRLNRRVKVRTNSRCESLPFSFLYPPARAMLKRMDEWHVRGYVACRVALCRLFLFRVIYARSHKIYLRNNNTE